MPLKHMKKKQQLTTHDTVVEWSQKAKLLASVINKCKIFTSNFAEYLCPIL